MGGSAGGDGRRIEGRGGAGCGIKRGEGLDGSQVANPMLYLSRLQSRPALPPPKTVVFTHEVESLPMQIGGAGRRHSKPITIAKHD